MALLTDADTQNKPMLDRRAPELLPVEAPRELPQLPAVSDNRLLTALTRVDGEPGSPFGSSLPNLAELVVQAIYEPPPTPLHDEFQRRVGQALTDLAQAAGQVAAAASALSPRNAFSAFQQIGVTGAEAGSVRGVALAGAHSAVYHLLVLHAAQAQENVGTLLPAETMASIAPGAYEMRVRTRSGGRLVRVDIGTNESNEDVLARLAAVINQAGLGLLATLARPTSSLVQLVVTAGDSGEAGAFWLEDGPELLRLSGAQYTIRKAQDAEYVLNGIQTHSPSNTVLLQGGRVQLTLLRAAPDAQQTLVVGADRDAVLAAVAKLIDCEQRLAEIVDEHSRSLSPAFVNSFRELIDGIRPGLAEIGISGSGTALALDRSVFEAVLTVNPARVETALSSPEGLVQQLGHFATTVISSPVSRLGGPDFIPPLPEPGKHPTPPMVLASNTLSALLYAQLFAQGLFINSLF